MTPNTKIAQSAKERGTYFSLPQEGHYDLNHTGRNVRHSIQGKKLLGNLGENLPSLNSHHIDELYALAGLVGKIHEIDLDNQIVIFLCVCGAKFRTNLSDFDIYLDREKIHPMDDNSGN